MNKEIQFSELGFNALHHRGDLFVVSDVALKGLRAFEALSQLFDLVLEAVVLVIKNELRALARRRFRNRPRDALFVRHSQDQAFLAFKKHIVDFLLVDFFVVRWYSTARGYREDNTALNYNHAIMSLLNPT